jgi:hypothetical protein
MYDNFYKRILGPLQQTHTYRDQLHAYLDGPPIARRHNLHKLVVKDIVVVVNEHMPQGGLSWGRLYTGGSGGGKVRSTIHCTGTLCNCS